MPPLIMMELAETKRIFTAIGHVFDGLAKTCLVVTSAARAEGKTTVVAGLGAAAAGESGKRVLAVDLNWFAPTLHEQFGLDPVFDYVDLSSERSITNFAQPSGVENLDILTAPAPRQKNDGAGKSGSLIGSEIVKMARQAYDIVLVDTCSVFPTNRYMIDPLALSGEADGTLLVVLANVTPRQAVKQTHMRLEASGAKVTGVVVNQWKNKLFG